MLNLDSLLSKCYFSRKTTRGFSLIEMTIVMSVLAILTAIAVPSYLEQVRKARRADATSSLLDRSQLLERCFTRLNAYNAAGCPDPEGPSPDGHYTVSVVRTTSTYTLTATPNGDQSGDRCGAFSLDYLGNKTPVPGDDRCWGS